MAALFGPVTSKKPNINLIFARDPYKITPDAGGLRCLRSAFSKSAPKPTSEEITGTPQFAENPEVTIRVERTQFHKFRTVETSKKCPSENISRG